MKWSVPGQRAAGENDHRMRQGEDGALRSVHLSLSPWSPKIHQLFLNDPKWQSFVHRLYRLTVNSENVQQHTHRTCHFTDEKI